MTSTILQQVAKRIEWAGWGIETIEPRYAHITVRHSNGDDLAHLSCLNEVWQGFWQDCHGEFIEGVAFAEEIPADSTDVDRIAAAAIRALYATDPTCDRCGCQGGHTAEDCDAEPEDVAEWQRNRAAYDEVQDWLRSVTR